MTLDERQAAVPSLRGRRVVVVGLGRSGVAAVEFLAARGAAVTVSERRSRQELGGEAERVESQGGRVETGEHRPDTFAGADLIVTSPGVPLSSPAFAAARSAGVPVWAEVELASRFLRGTLLAVTGSNGKSTVTALAAHLLNAAGLEAVACGNIGVPLVSLADGDHPGRRYVVEMSSFQLEGIVRFHPRVAAVTNVSPDHQDRYAGMDEYAAAKERVLMNLGAEDHAVLNADDPIVAGMRGPGGPRQAFFSASGPVSQGAGVDAGRLTLTLDGRQEEVLPAADLPLVGRHNVENALAAMLLARLAGAGTATLAGGLRSFRGLPHRMELVATVGGVDWLNDSKATNPAATARVVESIDRPLVLILGGRDKGADFGALRDALAGRVRRLILMGEAADLLDRALGDVADRTRVRTLEEAVDAARNAAQAGDAVLLAPACASFDAYRNFEERGEHFRRLVGRLAGEADDG